MDRETKNEVENGQNKRKTREPGSKRHKGHSRREQKPGISQCAKKVNKAAKKRYGEQW